MIDDIVKIEELIFKPNNYEGLETSSFLKKFYNESVTIIAPHNVRHLKGNGKEGLPELYTASTSIWLAKELNVGVTIAVRSSIIIEEKQSPNFYNEMVYNDGFYIDLHGARDSHGFDFCLGVGALPSEEQKILIKKFQDCCSDLKCNVNKPFGAKFINSCPNNCKKGIQIEITKKLRDPKNNPDDFMKMINIMSSFIASVKEL